MNAGHIIAATSCVALACGGIQADAIYDDAGASDAGDAASDVVDASDDFDVPPAPCPLGGGLQVGSPWPMANRCPTRESRTNEALTQHPTIHWTVQTSGGSGTPVIAADGTIYVSGCSLSAVSPAGEIEWTYTLGTSWDQGLLSPIIGADGSLYVATRGGALMALDTSGNTEWVFAPACTPSQGWQLGCTGGYPTMGDDGTLYTGISDGVSATVYALMPSGQVSWSYAVPPSTFPSGIGAFTTTYDGSIVFDFANELIALSPAGSLEWIWTNGQTEQTLGEPGVSGDGTVYVIDNNVERLYAVRSNGVEAWEYDLGLFGDQLMAPAVASDGTLYVGGAAGLRAIQRGPLQTKVWGYGTHGEVLYAPSVAGDGTIYVSYTIGVGALSATGAERWLVQTPHAITTSVAIGRNGTVYAVDEPGILYAIGP